MAPALQLTKPDVRDAMKESGRGITSNMHAGKTRSALRLHDHAKPTIYVHYTLTMPEGCAFMVSTASVPKTAKTMAKHN